MNSRSVTLPGGNTLSEKTAYSGSRLSRLSRTGFHDDSFLSDPSPSLRDDGRYAIRLANEDIAFVEQAGWNIFADDIVVH